MKIKMISSEDKEEWLKETYDYLQKLKEDKYGDVRLDYIMLYELHKEEHKEIKRLNNGIKELDDMFYETFRISQNGYFSISEWELKEFTDKLKELKEGK